MKFKLKELNQHFVGLKSVTARTEHIHDLFLCIAAKTKMELMMSFCSKSDSCVSGF